MNKDLNFTIERIIALYDSGGNPNQMMQTMISRNPNANQLGMQFSNMTQGRSIPEFLIQLAKQGGINDKNIEGLKRIFKIKS